MSDPLELFRCAQANFDNLTTFNPGIAAHPMYKAARLQLDAGVNVLEGNVCDHGEPPEFPCEKCEHDRAADGITDGGRL